MNISICYYEKDSAEEVVEKVKQYFFSVRKVHIDVFSTEEMKERLRKRTYQCDMLLMDMSTKNVGAALKQIAKVMDMIPTCQLICYSHKKEIGYYPELFGFNLTFFLHLEGIDELLPTALELAVDRINLVEQNCLICKSNHTILKIYFDDIIYIERSLHATLVYTEKECYSIRRKLNEPEPEFEAYPAIVRCHMSFFVNYKYVMKYSSKKLELQNGVNVPISRKYTKEIQDFTYEWLKKVRTVDLEVLKQ